MKEIETNYNSKRSDLENSCFKCKKRIAIKWIPFQQKYSEKNIWERWTENEKDKGKFICDKCLSKFYYQNKLDYLRLITSLKKRQILRRYVQMFNLKEKI